MIRLVALWCNFNRQKRGQLLEALEHGFYGFNHEKAYKNSAEIIPPKIHDQTKGGGGGRNIAIVL